MQSPATSGRIKSTPVQPLKFDSVDYGELTTCPFAAICLSEREWIPDSLCEHCAICKKSFTFSRRRHHCRRCGRCFCKNCSSETFPLESEPSARVCDLCYYLLQDTQDWYFYWRLNELLDDPDVSLQRSAALGFRNSLIHDSNRQNFGEIGLRRVVDMLSCPDEEVLEHLLAAFVNYTASSVDRFALQVVRSGLLPHLLTRLKSSYIKLQYLAACVVRNLARVERAQNDLRDSGILTAVTQMFASGCKGCEKPVVATMASVAATSTGARSLLDGGMGPVFIQHVSHSDPEVQRFAARGIGALAAADADSTVAQIGAEGTESVVNMLDNVNENTQESAVMAILSLSTSEEAKRLLVQSGAVQKLVTLLRAGSPRIRLALITILANMSATAEHMDVLAAECVDPVCTMMMEGDSSVQASAARVLANIARVESHHPLLEQCVPALVTAQASSDDMLRTHATAALSLLNASVIGQSPQQQTSGVDGIVIQASPTH